MDNQNFSNGTNNNGTTLVPAQCTNCGGLLKVDPSQEAAVCQFCGTPFIVSKAVNNYNVQNNTYQTTVVNQAKKGTVESILDYASQRKQQQLEEERLRAEEERRRAEEERKRAEEERIRKEEQQKKKKTTALWILGWIFFFPIPLTIILMRQKDMNPKVKYGIIVGVWVVFIILALAGGGRDKEETPKETYSASATTAASTTQKMYVPETEAETQPTYSEAEILAMKKAVENGDYSKVTPSFKSAMDDYEAFYDEYIAFMKKYSSSTDNMISMLIDYEKMIAKEALYSSKLDAIDESTLSPADDAYYLLVTLRVEKKLLAAGGLF